MSKLRGEWSVSSLRREGIYHSERLGQTPTRRWGSDDSVPSCVFGLTTGFAGGCFADRRARWAGRNYTNIFVDLRTGSCHNLFEMGKLPKPTEAELTILRVLWQQGPSTVRQVHRALNEVKKSGYTTVLKFMQIMHEKGLVSRDEAPYAHVYKARLPQVQAERTLVADLLDRAFEGSMSRLLLQALSSRKATAGELAEIRKVLNDYERGAK